MKQIFYFASVLLLCSYTLPKDQTTVYLIGDSTMSVKEVSAYPETGWGMPFAYFFDERVKIDNRAMNGRSTRTFLSENRWEEVHRSLKPGDYVFIQFGHNDEVKEKTDRYTSPEEYANNLHRFVAETRSKNANPILLSPVARRKFNDSGNALASHPVYADIVRNIAIKQGVPFIDLDSLSQDVYQKMGAESSKLLFLQLEAGEHPNYPNGKIDNTHFNELGARKIAQLVLAELKRMNSPLMEYVVKVKKA